MTFRDNEVWGDLCQKGKIHALEEGDEGHSNNPSISVDSSNDLNGKNVDEKSNVEQQEQLPNHERQALLAAQLLGDSVIDGKEAVRCGLAK